MVVATTDDLAAEHLDRVAVTSEGFVCKPLLKQVEQERLPSQNSPKDFTDEPFLFVFSTALKILPMKTCSVFKSRDASRL